MKPWNLKNRTALITGGTKGIGRATVEMFLDLGAKVLFTARNQSDIDAFLVELKSKGFDMANGLKSDITEKADRQNLQYWISENWHSLNVLVNNAGTNIRKSAQDYNSEEISKVLNTNLLGLYDLTIMLLPQLSKSKNASIVNVASVAGSVDVGSGAPYGMSKGGLIQLTRNLAVEWAGHGIRVNAVSPWYTETPLTETVLTNEARLKRILSATPMNRVAQPEEVASVIAFLAIDHASFISGQDISVDGGMRAKGM